MDKWTAATEQISAPLAFLQDLMGVTLYPERVGVGGNFQYLLVHICQTLI